MEQSYKCISIHGGVLYFCVHDGSLKTTHDINHLHVVTVSIDDERAYFSYMDANQQPQYILPSNYGSATYDEKKLIGDPCRAIKYFGNYMYFEKNRFFISSNPDGSVDYKVYMEAYERFYLVSSSSLVAKLLSNNWYSAERKAVIERSEVTLESNFVLNLGGVKVTFDALDRYAYIVDEKEVVIVHDGFKIDRLSIYRPAIYFSSFGRDQSFELLRMSIASIERFGKYAGDYLIVTNRPESYICNLLSFISPVRIHVIAAPVIDEIDMVCARFKIAELPQTQFFQPVLYMDTDIICNSSIEGIFTAIIDAKENICVKVEGELTLDPYGFQLTSSDEKAQIVWPNKGFSTGVIGFKNVGVVKADFKAIVSCIYYQIESGIDRHNHIVYDQPVANYYFNKLSSYNVTAIDHLVEGWPPLENEKVVAQGLIHFCGGVGPMHKIDRIKSYFNFIMAAALESN